ncbi:zinc finger BED domain-containing protein 4-like [Rhizophagus irregularis DAOM 181602=DAOM 197198]|nr:zinc finger BED domain-containing protein 4-like [Rhizophagus irregularis DAOM 181602=DAOM 197198]
MFWIWEYFIKGFNDKDELIIICQVEGEEGKKCNVKLKHDGSTGNGISHLWSVHKITKDGKQPADKQQKLDVIKKHPEKWQNTLCQFLVNWIIDDLQPFSVVNSPSFCIFCNELDPAFLVPEAKTIKAIIH